MQRSFCAVGCIILLFALAVTAGAAGSWSSFTGAEFSDIYVNVFKSASGCYDYTLKLGSRATVDGNLVESVMGFYLLSEDKKNTFTADGFDIPLTTPPTKGDQNADWIWDQDPNKNTTKVTLAGWSHNANKSDGRLHRPGSKTFTYTSLDFEGNKVLYGLHLSYYTDATHTTTTTGSFKDTSNDITPVPEPGTLLAACSILAPIGLVFRRRSR